VDAFEALFPNFSELTELLRRHFALSSLGDGRVKWPSVLLVGEAGIGKTEAARWLAERFGLPFHVFDMAASQTGSPLAGSEIYWSNSDTGDLFKLLAFQRYANPIVLLDELDKVDGNKKQYDPIAALYPLLEQRSAREFRDLSAKELAIDASHVNWLATANDESSLPAPIKSRFTVLHIPTPNAEQTRQIAQNVYQRLRSSAAWGSVFDECLDESPLDALQALPPRELRKTLEKAFGGAAMDGRTKIQAEDLIKSMPRRKAPRGIGFHADI